MPQRRPGQPGPRSRRVRPTPSAEPVISRTVISPPLPLLPTPVPAERRTLLEMADELGAELNRAALMPDPNGVQRLDFQQISDRYQRAERNWDQLPEELRYMTGLGPLIGSRPGAYTLNDERADRMYNLLVSLRAKRDRMKVRLENGITHINQVAVYRLTYDMAQSRTRMEMKVAGILSDIVTIDRMLAVTMTGSYWTVRGEDLPNDLRMDHNNSAAFQSRWCPICWRRTMLTTYELGDLNVYMWRCNTCIGSLVEVTFPPELSGRPVPMRERNKRWERLEAVPWVNRNTSGDLQARWWVRPDRNTLTLQFNDASLSMRVSPLTESDLMAVPRDGSTPPPNPVLRVEPIDRSDPAMQRLNPAITGRMYAEDGTLIAYEGCDCQQCVEETARVARENANDRYVPNDENERYD